MNLRETVRFIIWLRKRRIGFPVRLARAARESGIDPASAAVLIRKETNGRNIFGCDHGDGVAFCHLPVTKERVEALRRSPLRNGIGPAQLTSDAWVEACGWDKVHRPFLNMLTAFKGFKSMQRSVGLHEAARRYNGAEEYADDFQKRYNGVRASLRGAKVI